jgi:hypothetical protein
MLKIKFNLLPLIVFGLITSSAPAHAEGSFFDSLSKKFTDISQTVSDKIKGYYGDDSRTSSYPKEVPTKVQTQTPVAPVESSLSQCRKFLGLMYNPYYESDPKIAAAIYLNAALDFTGRSLDAKPSSEEIAERNKCVELALEAGADPDSNGENRNVDDPYSHSAPAPLVRAVTSNNKAAVKILLDHKANPNIQDTSMGMPIPLMNTALYKSQEIAVDLINAGIDLTTTNLLWIAASNAADRVVDLLIQSKKIPVNQINKFGDEYSADEEGETALDVSENNLFALAAYQKKFSSNSKISLQDKISEVNSVLYYNYPLKPQLKMSETVDPDAFINDLMIRQQKISNSLKAAGWTCKKDNCDILDFGDTP